MASSARLILMLYAMSIASTVSGIDLEYYTREKVEKSIEPFQKSLEIVKTIVEGKNTKHWSGVFKKMLIVTSRFGPAFGGFAGAAINCALAFLGQDDPVLTEVKTQFAEVNRKLDSISSQIDSLKTVVMWANYASIYSKDELKITYAWEKFNEFMRDNMAATDKDQKRILIQRFIDAYQGTDESVFNFYKYLTGNQPSLTENLLDLLVEKCNGDLSKVNIYSAYFQTLMWKGLQLNLIYYKLKDFSTEAKVKESVTQYYNVTQALKKTYLYCIENFKTFMINDVKVIGNSKFFEMNELATEVREFLNNKYNWYDWIVVVYNKDDDGSHEINFFTKIPLEKFIVAVSFSESGSHYIGNTIKEYTSDCVKNIKCSMTEVLNNLPECAYKFSRYGPSTFKLAINQIAAIHVSQKNYGYSEHPEPLLRKNCYNGFFSVYVKSDNQIREPNLCSSNTDCGNGQCKTILDISLTICDCNEGFYGEKCENNIQDDFIENKSMFVSLRTTFKILDYYNEVEFKYLFNI
uniref:EGF-like domain-containing protein n=1 Tax=Esox lucius TaxID=8010 RepID=A0A3P8Y7X4_ESOLU